MQRERSVASATRTHDVDQIPDFAAAVIYRHEWSACNELQTFAETADPSGHCLSDECLLL